MKTNRQSCLSRAAALILASGLAFGLAATADAQTVGTSFTYQGELAIAGAPANGTYDVQFRLYSASTGGTQVGTTFCSNDLSVENGRFVSTLDFGAVFTGAARFLEISVRQDAGLGCSDSSGYTTLLPRQELTAAPNASFATIAANASSLNGQPASFYQSAANLTGTLPSARLSGAYSARLTLTNPLNVLGGDGAAIRNIVAANIVGRIDEAKMPLNWAAGGDLTGTFPNPSIGPGVVTLSKLDPNVQSAISQIGSEVSPLVSLGWTGWGFSGYGQIEQPPLPEGMSYTALSIGESSNVAIRSDGLLLAWGSSSLIPMTPTMPPVGLAYTAVSAGASLSVALRSDGSIVAWGYDSYGGLNVPILPPDVTYTAIASGGHHALALRSDGNVVGWGYNESGQTFVPDLPPGVVYQAIAASVSHSLALRSDGTIAAWGDNASGQLDVPALPPGIAYTAIAAGNRHSMALRSDGTVVVWGTSVVDVTDVPVLPAGVTYTAISSGSFHCIALRSDGHVVTWGRNAADMLAVPALPRGVRYTGLVAGGACSFARRETIPTPFLTTSGSLSIGSSTLPPAVGGLSVSGDSTFGASLTAASFIGDGSRLANLSASSLSGIIGASLIPNLDASKITTGVLGASQIPELDASKITTGTLGAAQIPSLDASKITTGTLGAAQIPSLDASKITTGTLGGAQIPNLDASKITSGTLGAAQIPNLDASKITTGTLSNARTTGTNLNTPGALVARDASGNFSAGTITATAFAGSGAALTGLNASAFSSGVLPNSRFGGQYSNAVTLNNTSNSFSGTFTGTLIGDGSAITGLSAANMTTGTLAAAQIPGLDASKITTGALAVARLPVGGAWAITSNLNIDANTLVVDQLNARVGIGTATPAYTLDVAGSAQLAGAGRLQFNGRGHIQTNELLYLNPFTGGGNIIIGGAGGSGNLQVLGSLAKAGGSFKIDHPLDPENKYLYHSFVESPDMMNVYNGTVTTDANGYATITMPDYFEALNRDFRYQLTVLNDGDTGQFALAQVVRKISSNQFTIRTSLPQVEVSWQVTGIRHDAWANKNRIPNSVDKPAGEKGKLLHPEAFNQPVEKGVHFAVPAAAMNQ